MDPTVSFLHNNVVPFEAWFSDTDELSAFSTSPTQPKPDLTIARNPLQLRTALRNPDTIVWANLDAIINLTPYKPVDDKTLSYRLINETGLPVFIFGSDGACEYFNFRNPKWTLYMSDIVEPKTWTFPPADNRLISLPSSLDTHGLRNNLTYLRQVGLVISGLYVSDEHTLAHVAILAMRKLAPKGVMVVAFHADFLHQSKIFALLSTAFDRSTVVAPISRLDLNHRFFVATGFNGANEVVTKILNQLIKNPAVEVAIQNSKWQQWYEKEIVPIQSQNTDLTGEYLLPVYGWWCIPSPRVQQIIV